MPGWQRTHVSTNTHSNPMCAATQQTRTHIEINTLLFELKIYIYAGEDELNANICANFHIKNNYKVMNIAEKLNISI